jgi:hypothetical protein
MAMSANPRLVLNTVTYNWDGGTWTLPAGTIIDPGPPGSALETAIGASNLGILSIQALSDAANGGAGGISN